MDKITIYNVTGVAHSDTFSVITDLPFFPSVLQSLLASFLF